MAVLIGGGTSGSAVEVGAAAQKAMHVSIKPDDVGSLGEYRWSGATGALVATVAAGATLLSLRNPSTNLIVVKRITIGPIYTIGAITTGVMTATGIDIARSFTAADTGGTAVSFATNQQKMRTSMGNTNATLNVATTAGLTAGTRTVDAASIYRYDYFTTIAANSKLMEQIEVFAPDGVRYPVVLAQNEGLLIRQELAGPATGTFQVGMSIVFAELPAF